MVHKAARLAYAHGLAKDGQRLVITAGVPFGMPGSTNILRIAWVERPSLPAPQEARAGHREPVLAGAEL